VHSLTIGNLAFYYVGCIGLLGWADLKLQPHLAYLLPWVSFFLVWLFGPKLKARITIFQSLWYLLLVFLSGLLVMTALYVTWCRVGQGTIEGVQGRYFIPVFALAGIALLRWARGWSPKGGEWLALAGLAAMILLQVAITDLTIIHAFGLFS
jgi:uncharacterized membrane protein